MTDLKAKLKKIPSKPGVYFFKNKNRQVIYIGKSVNLKNRVKSYFQNKNLGLLTQKMVAGINQIDFLICDSEFEALLLEAKLINKYQPQYNIQYRDDKSFLMIVVSQEKYPRIYTSRKKDDPNACYYGPFTSAGEVKTVMKFLRQTFAFRSCKKIPKKPCLYYYLKLCPGCCRSYSSSDYQKTINKILKLLSGNPRGLLRQLKKEMAKASQVKNYEKAAMLKKQINGINYIVLNWQSYHQQDLSINLGPDEQEKILSQAKTIIPKIKALARIEAYDISNLYGKQATGSMIVFTNFIPQKDQYRRFKIKSKSTADDLAMIQEVLQRRLKHQDWQYPELMVIDGGRSQVAAAFAVLKQQKLAKKIYLLGLAKKQDLIIKPDIKQGIIVSWNEIKLDKDNPFLKLLQQLRDESHRFAKKYHLFLRKNKLKLVK